MELTPHLDALILADDQGAKLCKVSDAIVSRNLNQKYLSIEETLKSENCSVNREVEAWKRDVLGNVEREMKEQTASYVDRFHAMTCRRPEATVNPSEQDGTIEEDEVTIINSLNKTIQLDPAWIECDSKPSKPKSRNDHHVIFLLETKIKQLEKELREAKSALRIKGSAYEELLGKLNTSEIERRKTIIEGRNLRDINKKLENQTHDLKARISAQATEQDKLAKSLAHLTKNNKHIDLSVKNKDILVNKLTEEKKCLSADVARLTRVNQDMQAKLEKDVGHLEMEMRRLEKQKNQLYIGFKKQQDYINILKQQRVVQAAKSIHELQKQDFFNLLENPQKAILDFTLEKALNPGGRTNSGGGKSLSDRGKSLSVERRSLSGDRKTFSAERKIKNGEEKCLSEDRKCLHGEVKILSGEKYSLSEDRKSLNFERKAMSREKQPLREDEYSLRGEGKNLNEEKKSLSGEKNTMIREKQILSGERNSLRGDRNSLRGEGESLNVERKTLSGENQTLNRDEKNSSGEDKSLSVESKSLSGEKVSLSDRGKSLNVERKNLIGDGKSFSVERNSLREVSGEKKCLSGERNSLSLERNVLSDRNSMSLEGKSLSGKGMTFNEEGMSLKGEKWSCSGKGKSSNEERNILSVDKNSLSEEKNSLSSEDKKMSRKWEFFEC